MKMIRFLFILSGIVLAALLAVVLFVSRTDFGRLPRGARQQRIEQSPNFRDGRFRNRQPTPLMTSGKGRLGTMLRFLFGKKAGELRPARAVPAIKTDLRALDPAEELLVWFGHSSYLIQSGGRRILVDPVFCRASPLSFVNRPFPGTDIYTPEDMPPIDYLVITHDHWDHLDYLTVTALRDRIGRVICPLGVGEHFEYWGFAPERIVETDWDETCTPEDGFSFHCLPARHFSGRGLRSNRTLWASFLVESPARRIFIGGDGGYGDHFARIGERFPGIDLAILENGQYNTDWSLIHTLPQYLGRAAKELRVARILTVHHSKYALSRHPWDEPLGNARQLREQDSLDVLTPRIGEPVPILSARQND